MKVVTIDQMLALEAGAVMRGTSLDRLMENAGLCVAQRVSELLGQKPKGEHVTVLVGPGNNGGDGLVAARHLNDWGLRVHVFLCAPRPPNDAKLEALREHVVDIVDLSAATGMALLAKALGSCKLAVDAVLGASHARRGVTGSLRDALGALAAARQGRRELVVVAVDVPSGLDADTGACDPATPSADVTVTLGCPKVGLFQFPGAGRVGRLIVEDIGVPPDLAGDVKLELLDAGWVASHLPVRPLDANKGTFGSVLVVAGSSRYIGAAALACGAAIRAGAGKVTLATPGSLVPVIAGMVPEVTFLPLAESDWGVIEGGECGDRVLQELGGFDALLLGPGLGQEPGVTEMVQRLLFGLPRDLQLRVIIDADGLNILSRVPDWWKKVRGDVVITPHPGEMQRLTRTSIEGIQTNRIKTARDAAAQWNKTVLLKGAYSIVAAADGVVRLNPFANPALATAGTGDVLSGVIAALLAQGLTGERAAAVGAFIHGQVGEMRREETGDSGLAASDLIPLIPTVVRKLRG